MISEEKANMGGLFPILQPGLSGMARMAAEAAHTDDGYLVEFRTMEARSILSRVVSKRRLLLDYSINPYRGCEFGCRYCYARYTHEFMELDASEFEDKIYAKAHTAELLRRDLRKVAPAQSIAIGTATDPYQPAERRFGRTRAILEVFAE